MPPPCTGGKHLYNSATEPPRHPAGAALTPVKFNGEGGMGGMGC
jgi:hypothetical protein